MSHHAHLGMKQTIQILQNIGLQHSISYIVEVHVLVVAMVSNDDVENDFY